MQFRELEFLSGAKDPGYLERFRGLTDDETGPAGAPAGRAVAVGRVPRTSYAGPGSTADNDDERTASLLTVARDRSTTARSGSWARRCSSTTRTPRCGGPGT